MKWTGIILSCVVTLALIVGVGMLITQIMPDDEPDSGERAGRRGGAGGGHRRGGMKKQEVETENHGQLEFHLIEINEDEEGGETSGGSLGENVVIALASIAAIVFLCICSGCKFMAYRCGLCPKRRESRRRHLSLSSILSGRKQPAEHEEIELGELRRKLQGLEMKSMRKEEETVPRIKVPRGQRAIMNMGVKVGRLAELDTLPEASMEEYNKRLDATRKLMEELEEAKQVVKLHAEHV